MAVDQKRTYAEHLLAQLSDQLGDSLVKELIEAPQANEAEFAKQRRARRDSPQASERIKFARCAAVISPS